MVSSISQLMGQLAAGLEAGAKPAVATRAAAKLMSALENDPTRVPELFVGQADEQTARDASPRLVLGITGAPGSGKSTLTDSLVTAYRLRHPHGKVGVIAVDPSSPFTGGAVLGDRVRMMRHATDPNVFIRSMSARGHLGGLSLGVRGVLHVMAMAGCELIIIETVGVGQSEVEIANVADLTMIIFAPGQGDSIQLLKAGLMEIGDMFVVNKADRAGADELHNQLLTVLKLGTIDDQCGHHHGIGLPGEKADNDPAASPELGLMRSGRLPDVHLVSAQEQTGLDELLDAVERRADAQASQWRKHRAAALNDEIREAILEEARRRVQAALGRNGTMHGQVARVLSGEVSIRQLTDELLATAHRSERDVGPGQSPAPPG